MSSEYIHSLNIYYDKWINKLETKQVLLIKTDDFDIYKDDEKYKIIKEKVENKLNG